jgi:hypothetical protein
MSREVAVLIQAETRWGYRDCLREGILLATYFIVWKDWHDVNDKNIKDAVKQYYDMAPPEIARNAAVELVDRIMDETVEILGGKREKYTIRELLIFLKTGKREVEGSEEILVDTEKSEYRRVLARYGIKIIIEGESVEVAIQNNNHEIRRILETGTGYNKYLARHPGYVDGNRVVSMAGASRRATILEGLIE